MSQLLAAAPLIGCGGVAALEPPAYDPDASAELALAKYDSNGDGVIDENELDAAPGMKAALVDYDKDEDGRVTGDEVRQRIQYYVNRGTALMRVMCSVTYGGKPLEGALIRFIPEEYFGGEVNAAEGTTNRSGRTSVAIPKENLPENQRKIGGINLGTYRVEITHPTISIPAKYNTETTLGYESRPGIRNVDFDLKKR